MTEHILVMVTCSNRQEANEIAEAAVTDHLAACVSVAGRFRSFFHWEGELQKETEWLLLIKTVRHRFKELARRIAELHSYEVPEIIATPILEGHPAYLNWLDEATAKPSE